MKQIQQTLHLSFRMLVLYGVAAVVVPAVCQAREPGITVVRRSDSPLPSVPSNGVISASAYGALPAASPGSWIEIYGTNLAADTRPWTIADFKGVNAPTSLDGTSVTIGGQPAFVGYISPTHVNVRVQ